MGKVDDLRKKIEEEEHIIASWDDDQTDVYNFLKTQPIKQNKIFNIVNNREFIIFQNFNEVLQDFADTEGERIPEWIIVDKVATWDNLLSEYYCMIDDGDFYWQIENSHFIQYI